MAEPSRQRVWPQVVAATVVTALVLGAIATAVVEQLGAGGRDAAGLLRTWGLWSALSLPVAFVFGGVAFAIGRSVWRGRRRG